MKTQGSWKEGERTEVGGDVEQGKEDLLHWSLLIPKATEPSRVLSDQAASQQSMGWKEGHWALWLLPSPAQLLG